VFFAPLRETRVFFPISSFKSSCLSHYFLKGYLLLFAKGEQGRAYRAAFLNFDEKAILLPGD
jgi:hypothetical protein